MELVELIDGEYLTESLHAEIRVLLTGIWRCLIGYLKIGDSSDKYIGLTSWT